MKIDLTQKVAIVTGGSKGIGAAIAKELAACGAIVVITYHSAASDADRVINTIREAGGQAIALQADIARHTDIINLFKQVKEQFGQLDVLVNNAGIARFGPIEAVTEDDFLEQYRVNVLGPMLAIQESLTYFPQTGGSIVNVSSVGGQNPGPYTSIYTSSKAALNALTVSLSRELVTRYIRVNTVAPGPTDTEGSKALGLAGTAIEQGMIAAIPMGRFGKPDEIAPAVAFLASDQAGWITGETLAVSGGMR
ncbi:SDR family NAD(P)-dependent oxidoreductase [Spirosoma radiotolerans]|uniref:Oxidoreductase n=1 Tax=Spirosoma radiotolerans TaxID=1379870 RepID=A0A0E3ZT57_9BACT|nr:glucose 1-dehydrogenase [Spirosoma radiotolerans]AKD53859.1 oxidoreductase [Spirosoma radiotolerans]